MKPHLCLIPGFDGTGILFEPLVKILSPHCGITVATHTAESSFAELVTAVESKLPKGKEVFVLAESYGGPIAIELLFRNSLSVSGVILCATFAETPFPKLVRLAKNFPDALLGIEAVRNWALDLFGIDKNTEPQVKNIAREILRGENPDSIGSKLKILEEIDVYKETKSIDVPVLYLRASRDRIVSKHLGNKLLSKIRNVKLVEIDGPHLILQSKPAESAEAIMNFVLAVLSKQRGYQC